MPLRLGGRITLVGGKGGVGKTTVAAALAVRLAKGGDPRILISVDPAHSLGDALGIELEAELRAVPGVPQLRALEVDAAHERHRFLQHHRQALLSLLEEGTYMDADDAADLLDQAIPGLDEVAALLRLGELLAEGTPLIIDTAPAGHTLRLLESPELARSWLDSMLALEDRREVVSNALVGAHPPDATTLRLRQISEELHSIEATLRDPQQTRFVLVTTNEPLVAAETLRLHDELSQRRIPIGGVVVNRATSQAPAAFPVDAQVVVVPLLPLHPVGIDALQSLGARLTDEQVRERWTAQPLRSGDLSLDGLYTPPLTKSLYLAAGKGGVGKSTVAATVALRLRDEARRVPLLGVDPAGSLSELLRRPVGDAAREVPTAPGLWVRQLHRRRAWDAFRARYQETAAQLFRGIVGGPMSTGPGEALVEQLEQLTPPGIDELAGVMEVIDALELGGYDAVVVDCAPTGHFLRMMEMPQVALGWTHETMRLLLKYREVVAPGALGEQLLELAGQLRAFSARLRTSDDCWPLIVTLPDGLAVAETKRLVDRLQAMSITPGTVLLNRSDAPGSGLDSAAALAELDADPRSPDFAAAPSLPDGPTGVAELRAFGRQWRWMRHSA